MEYFYRKTNKKLGKSYLISAIPIFIVVLLIDLQVEDEYSKLLNLFINLFYFTPFVFACYGLYCLLKGGVWEISINEKKIVIHSPSGCTSTYLNENVDKVQVIHSVNSFPSCYIFLTDEAKVKFNLNSGVSLSKFLKTAKANGIQIENISE